MMWGGRLYLLTGIDSQQRAHYYVGSPKKGDIIIGTHYHYNHIMAHR